MASVKSNFLWNSAYQVIRIIIPIIITPYLTRVLGSEQLGIYNYTYTIASYAILFIVLGLNQYGNRVIAKSKNDKELMTKNFWSIYVTQVISGIIVCLIYIAYLLTLSGDIALCSWIWLINVASEIFDLAWLFYGLEEFKVITIRNVVVRIVSIVAIFLFVHTQNDMGIYCLISALATVLNNGIFLAMLPLRISGFYKPSFKEVAAHVKPNLTLFAPMIAISLYTQINSFLLGNFATMSDVTYYSSSNAVVSIPLALIQSLGAVLLPRLSVVLKENDERAAQTYISTSMWISMLMCFGLLAGIFGVAELFVPTYYGPGYEDCIVILPVLCIMIVPCSISSVTGNQYLIPHEKDVSYMHSVVAGAIVNVTLCFILIPRAGAVGAAISTVVAEFAVAIYQIICIRDALPFKKYALDSLPFIFAAVIEYGAIKAVASVSLSAIPLLGLEILVGIISYCLTCVIILAAKKDRIFLSFLKVRDGLF